MEVATSKYPEQKEVMFLFQHLFFLMEVVTGDAHLGFL